jgi:hypothetical protein
MTRSAFSERKVIETLIRRGAVIPCYRCRAAFTLEDVPFIEREHLVEIALGGDNTPENAAYSHGQRSAQRCHGIVTNGNGATSAGSSKHRIAKTNRITGKTKDGKKASRFKPLPTGADVLERDDPASGKREKKYRWPKGRKLQGRGFEKRAR